MKKSIKWAKRFFYTLAAILSLLLISAWVLVYILNSESFFEDQIKQQLGMESEIGELDISIFSGSVNVGSSRIGPKNEPAIVFDSLTAQLSYSDLLSSRLVIEDVQLNKAKLKYPFDYHLAESSGDDESELLFDFIDVSNLQINHADFEYTEDITLIAKDLNLTIKDLSVAQDGLITFENLPKLFSTSKTSIRLGVAQLASDKSQLNNARLDALVENNSIVVKTLAAESAEVNMQLPTNSEQATTAKTPEVKLDIPFSSLVIEDLLVGKTNINLMAESAIDIANLELSFKGLKLVENKQALWLNWHDFYKSQNSVFEVASSNISSNKISLAQLNINGQLNSSQFTLTQLDIVDPSITLDMAASGSSSANAESFALPFELLLIEESNLQNLSAIINTSTGKEAVSKVNISIKQLPLILDSKLLFDAGSINVSDFTSSLSLDSLDYQGSYGLIESIDLKANLTESDLVVSQINVNQPKIKHKQTSSASGEEVGHLPLDSLAISSLKITDGSFELIQDSKTYSAESIDVEMKQAEVIKDSKLTLVEPKLWQKEFSIDLEAKSLEFPQGTIGNFESKATIYKGELAIAPLNIKSASFNISNEENVNSTNDQSPTLPFDVVNVKNLYLKNIDFAFNNVSDKYLLHNADLYVSTLPLIANGLLIDDPTVMLEKFNGQFRLKVEQTQIPQGRLEGLTINGEMRQKALDLKNVSLNSSDIMLNIPASQQSNDESKNTDETVAEVESFMLNKLAVQQLDLEGINLTLHANAEGKPQETSLQNLSLNASNLLLAKDSQLISNWYHQNIDKAFSVMSVKADLIKRNQNHFSNLIITAVNNQDSIRFMPFDVTINSTPVSVDWNIDISDAIYHSQLTSRLESIELDKLVVPATKESITPSGIIDADLNINFNGLTPETILSSMNGTVSLRNQQPLLLKNINANKVLGYFLDSQSFGLLDIGGFLLAGPAGLLLSQGASFQGVLSNLGADEGDTNIGRLNADIGIENGIISSKDIAASTEDYRFAFNGQINLVDQTFNDFEFDIVNEKGCSEYGQTLNGDLTSPEVETLKATFDAVTGSLVGLFKGGAELLTGGDCKVIYEGLVPHPEGAVEIIHKAPPKPAEAIEEQSSQDK